MGGCRKWQIAPSDIGDGRGRQHRRRARRIDRGAVKFSRAVVLTRIQLPLLRSSDRVTRRSRASSSAAAVAPAACSNDIPAGSRTT